MQIRYVVSTMVFWWREHHLSFEQECSFLKSLGFGVELWPTIRGHNECRFTRPNWPRLYDATKDMLVCLHSRNDGPTREEWDEQIQCAKMLNACIVTDLPSLCISDKLAIADWDFAAEVISLAEHHKVRLCVETGQLGTLLQVGKKFKSVWYCFDTGVANLAGSTAFKRYVDALADRIVHIHLSDNYGQLDDHEPPGLREGISRQDWEYLLNALSRFNNDIVGSLEMCPSFPDVMIRQASEFLFKIMNWPGPPHVQPGHKDGIYRPQ
ncbi:MAG: TIM barrel protein [Planctomycetota bacterium]